MPKSLMTASLAVLANLFALIALPHDVMAQKRVALVIGNSAYVNTQRLENPKNDAADIAATLKQLGFEVIQGLDLDKTAMDRTIRNFVETLSGAQLALFFFAGHGLQVNGQNFLVPIDAKLSSPAALEFETVRLELVQRTMERESTTNILVLDACRDNPLARNLARALGTRSAAIGRGLAAVESGEGTLISFSTQPGNVALDGTGRNSPFAAALVKHIAEPGEDLPTILIKVRNDVMAATERRQVPWEHSALTAKIFFTPPQPAALTKDQQIELTFWVSVKDSDSPAVFRTYLERYPKGEFASIARVLIEHYEQRAKADQAKREEDRKRSEEQIKSAEVQRLEEERRHREAALAEERKRAQDANNTAVSKQLDQREKLEAQERAEAIRRALEEEIAAREAAKEAEAKRIAAMKRAQEATETAEDAIARKRESVIDQTKLAALPKLEKLQAETRPSRKTIRLGSYSTWDASCRSLGLPPITVTVSPKQGKIDIRRSTHTVTKTISGGSNCMGTSQPSRFVYYIASEPPAATDRVVFQVRFLSRGNIKTVECRVWPAEGRASCS